MYSFHRLFLSTNKLNINVSTETWEFDLMDEIDNIDFTDKDPYFTLADQSIESKCREIV